MKRDDWATPRKLFDCLDDLFNFEIDGAASVDNALCKDYWHEGMDALRQNWNGKRIFCNPPYSKSKEFALKFLESQTSDSVMLLPVRSDRLWFQRLLNTDSLRCSWITGRLHFGGSGKGAFMYSILFYRTKRLKLNSYYQAGQFNDNGKGDAKS